LCAFALLPGAGEPRINVCLESIRALSDSNDVLNLAIANGPETTIVIEEGIEGTNTGVKADEADQISVLSQWCLVREALDHEVVLPVEVVQCCLLLSGLLSIGHLCSEMS
jgi:hypothetical protein